jgi:alkanesulfonate monooxygenase SsuD/methylene tetrahydromethanopterin reductase-like flavin-dependent oxidoreductase (luciferase family)
MAYGHQVYLLSDSLYPSLFLVAWAIQAITSRIKLSLGISMLVVDHLAFLNCMQIIDF